MHLELPSSTSERDVGVETGCQKTIKISSCHKQKKYSNIYFLAFRM